MRHPSPLQPGHQGTQRAALEFSLFDIGRDPAAVGGTVRIASIVPFRGFASEPVGALQPAGGASVGDHRSTSSEGFADSADQAFGLRLACCHFAERFQAGGHVGDQHVDDGQHMVWLAPLLGWARRGERRHAVAFAGGALLLAVVASLAGRV